MGFVKLVWLRFIRLIFDDEKLVIYMGNNWDFLASWESSYFGNLNHQYLGGQYCLEVNNITFEALNLEKII